MGRGKVNALGKQGGAVDEGAGVSTPGAAECGSMGEGQMGSCAPSVQLAQTPPSMAWHAPGSNPGASASAGALGRKRAGERIERMDYYQSATELPSLM